MANVNKAIIIGTVGQDPEIRYTPSGAAVCNLRVATNRSWKDKQSGEKKEEVEWHAIVLYDRQAEIAGEYLKKGKPVYIEGRLKTRKWQDKDGNDRYTTEIVSENMQLLGGREDGQERQEPAPRAPAKPAPRSASPRPAPRSSAQDMDDSDVPF